MAEEKTVEARMNLAPTPESFRSMAEFVALAERAANAAKQARESLHGSHPIGSDSPNRSGGSYRSDQRQDDVRQASPLPFHGTGYSGQDTNAALLNAIREMTSTHREAIRIMSAARYTPPASQPAVAAAASAYGSAYTSRSNPDLEDFFGTPSTARPAAPPRHDMGHAAPPPLGSPAAERESELARTTAALQRLTATLDRTERTGATRGGTSAGTAAGATRTAATTPAGDRATYGLLPQEGSSKTPVYELAKAEGESKARAHVEQVLGHRPTRGTPYRREDDPRFQAADRFQGGFDTATLSKAEVRAVLPTRLDRAKSAISGGGSGFLAGGLGRAAGIVGFGLEAIDGALDAKNQVNLMEGQGATGAEMQRSILKNMPITGYAQRQLDRFQGRDTDIALAQLSGQRRMIGAETQANIDTMRFGVAMDRVPLDAEVQVRRQDRRYAQVGSIDRSTLEGKYKFQEAEIMRPVEQGRIEAERRLNTEKRTMAVYQQTEKELQGKLVMAERERAKFSPNNPDRPTGAAGVTYANQGREAQMKVDTLTAQLKDLGQKIEQQRGNVGRAEVGLAQMDEKQLQARLQVGEAKENQARSQAMRIGSMDPMQLAMARQAARTVQQTGNLEALPKEMIDMAESIIPEKIAEMREELGVKRIRENGMVGGEFKEFRTDLRGQEDENAKTRDAMSKMQVDLQAKTAEVMANMFGPQFADMLAKAMQRGMESAMQKLQIQLNEKNATP